MVLAIFLYRGLKVTLQQLDPRRYLFFKIFSWFWFTILATIGLAIFLSNVTTDNVINEPLKGPMAKNLAMLGKSIERASKKSNRDVKEVVNHPRMTKHRLIYVVDEQKNDSYFNQALDKEIDISLISYTKDLSPQIIFTPTYHAFGPIQLNVEQKSYLLYEIQPDTNPHFIFKLKLMPTWLKWLIALGASLSLSLLFSKALMSPINALKKASSELARGQLKTRVSNGTVSRDELGQLTDEFNQMAEKIELLVTSQKRLLADISHELRSPLTRLQMAAGLAQMQHDNQHNPYIQRIEQEAENLDKMIADVLTVSRLEAQSQVLIKEKQGFNQVIDKVVSDAQFEAKQHNKTLSLSGHQDAQFSFDAKALASAFENILRNAIKYAQHHVTVELKQSEQALMITVCDDGPGVPEEYLTQIFEPFFRVSQARDRNSGGTGLGLAISKHAIEAHQGHISLYNQQSGGLCVTVTLPLISN